MSEEQDYNYVLRKLKQLEEKTMSIFESTMGTVEDLVFDADSDEATVPEVDEEDEGKVNEPKQKEEPKTPSETVKKKKEKIADEISVAYISAVQENSALEPQKTIRQRQWQDMVKKIVKEGFKSLNIFNLLQYMTSVGFSISLFGEIINLIQGT